MGNCITCQALASGITFTDFISSPEIDQTFVSTAQIVTVTCPSGLMVTVPLEGGIVSYVVDFQVGQPPYPNLTLNCIGGTISIPVPSTINEAGLTGLVTTLLNMCISQIATSVGCQPGSYLNTAQSISPCGAGAPNIHVIGAVPTGTSYAAGVLTISAGTVQSTISIADANAKALQLLNELYNTGNVTCGA
jgi:hypothetical protein